MMKNTPHNFVRSPIRRFPVTPAACTLVALGLLQLSAAPALAQYRDDLPDYSTPAHVENAPIVPKPNAPIPLDLPFTRYDGAKIKLGDLFNHGKPVILALVYFSCPNLCGITQDNLLAFVRESPHGIQLGKDYDIVIVSIDPDDTSAEATIKRKNYLAKVPLPVTQVGFTYLTGTADNIKTLADAIGFPYRRNPDNSGANKFAHDSGIFICTPDGHLSQTIVGVTYEPEEVHYRLRQASGGKIGGTLLGIALCCGAVWFNPKTGHYENNPWFYAGTATGLVTVGILAMFFTMLWKGEAKRKKLGLDDPDSPDSPEPPTDATT